MKPVRLPLGAARLCPDCDLVTESPVCPVCDRAGTFPLASWLPPLDDCPPRFRPRGGDEPARRTGGTGVAATRAPRVLVVVPPHERALYAFLRQRFDQLGVIEVVYERRVGDRRRGGGAPRGDRPRSDRRRLAPSAWLYALAPVGSDRVNGTAARVSSPASRETPGRS